MRRELAAVAADAAAPSAPRWRPGSPPSGPDARCDHAHTADTSNGAPTRSVFASTIAGCAGRLSRLAERACDVAMRGRRGEPDAVVQAMIDAAARRPAISAPMCSR